MILSSGQLEKINHSLQAELACAQTLLQILEREYKILNYGDAQQIETVTKEKLNRMSRLQQLLVEREQLLSQWKTKGVDATESIIGNLPNDSEITNNWQQLKDIAERLKQQNEINGVIITFGQRNIHNALDILNGRQQHATSTYNPQGEKQRVYGSNTLAKA